MTEDPAQLHILKYPARELRARTKAIQDIDDRIRAVAARMIDLMHGERGVGLAAPQVGLPLRMFVTHTPEEGSPRVYVNPRLTPIGSDRSIHEEGCLSIPGIHVEIERPTAVTLIALDLDGREITVNSDDFPARVWQHEFDHLNGVLIIDKMNPLDRLATRRTLKELEAEAAKKDEKAKPALRTPRGLDSRAAER